jgi:hypothetical protein
VLWLNPSNDPPSDPILHPERTSVPLQPNNQQKEMKRMKRTTKATKPPSNGKGIAAKPDGTRTVDPNTINLTEMTGICTVCSARVRIYQNESNVWVPSSHPSK